VGPPQADSFKRWLGSNRPWLTAKGKSSGSDQEEKHGSGTAARGVH